MALTSKSRSRPWSTGHYLLRVAGLIGFLVALVGAALVYKERLAAPESWLPALSFNGVGSEDGPSLVGVVGLYLVLGGGIFAVFALILEVFRLLTFGALNRSGAGLNASFQVLIVLGLLVLCNLYSFRHYLRLDWTRDERFTLPTEVQRQLGQLKGETTIVVLRQHRAFESLEPKEDNYDDAAEAKVMEKIDDLVDLLREFGPQFNVVSLDQRAEDYEDRVEELTKNSPDLKAAIERANENTVFFYVKDDPDSKEGKVQKLSFNALYQLDKEASRGGAEKKRNLDLLHTNYGIDPFTRRVFNIDAKKPKVAVITMHGYFSTRQGEMLGAKGLAQALADNGFEVFDIIIKKPGARSFEPAVLTYEESNFDSLDKELESLTDELNKLKKVIDQREDDLKKLEGGDEQALYRVLAQREVYLLLINRGIRKDLDEMQKLVEEAAKKWSDKEKVDWRKRAADFLKAQKKGLDEDRDALDVEVTRTRKDRDSYNVESVTELKRITDLKAKLDRLLADCDLIILPRLTIPSLVPLWGINSAWHQMSREQTGAIKQYLYEGKPMLACFGPPFTRGGLEDPLPPGGEDIEDALHDLGIDLGKQIVLHRAEAKALAGSTDDSFMPRAQVSVPPVQFDWKATSEEMDLIKDEPRKVLPPNPIRESMRLAAKSINPKPLDLQLRAARPIFIDKDKPFSFDPEIMRSDPKTWNEDRMPPWFSDPPRPPREDDPPGSPGKKGNGPFTLGVALETKVPDSWGKTTSGAQHEKARIVVLGHGGLFKGDNLSDNKRDAVKEKLLLDCCNWLVGRDDLLGREELLPKELAEKDSTTKREHQVSVWHYPRVTRWSAPELMLWKLGTLVGLPFFFLCLGCVVVLTRRLH